MKDTLLSLDPSIRACGVALFRADGLVSADTIKAKKGDDIGARCLRMAQEVVSWVVDLDAVPTTLVVEWPQIYTVDKSEGNPNDLIGLAGVCGAVAGILAMGAAQRNDTLTVVSYTPNAWAGQLPKSKLKGSASPRTARVLERLNVDERAILDAAGLFEKVSHDAFDAIGIGLKFLGRFERRRGSGVVR